MPNTLVHVGVQGALCRSFVSTIDLKWIYVGCVIPDVPWILQRVIRLGGLPVDLYQLRLYAIVQASLMGCLVLAGAIASLTEAPGKIFVVLSLNALAHLVLDALQIKWANGVHLFAPVSWTLWNVGLFWPESLVNYLLTGVGFAYILWYWRDAAARPILTRVLGARSWLVSGVLLLAYILAPVSLLNGPLDADNHDVATLLNVSNRTGRDVEFDRVPYEKLATQERVRTLANEWLLVTGHTLGHSGVVSIKGKFVARDTVEILELHEHSRWFRDSATIMALLLIGMLCFLSHVRYRAVSCSGDA